MFSESTSGCRLTLPTTVSLRCWRITWSHTSQMQIIENFDLQPLNKSIRIHKRVNRWKPAIPTWPHSNSLIHKTHHRNRIIQINMKSKSRHRRLWRRTEHWSRSRESSSRTIQNLLRSKNSSKKNIKSHKSSTEKELITSQKSWVYHRKRSTSTFGTSTETNEQQYGVCTLHNC